MQEHAMSHPLHSAGEQAPSDEQAVIRLSEPSFFFGRFWRGTLGSGADHGLIGVEDALGERSRSSSR